VRADAVAIVSFPRKLIRYATPDGVRGDQRRITIGLGQIGG
jgi:hypothetical protein